jgi:transcriptional regulator with GAF, ATPase, and Fis domain
MAGGRHNAFPRVDEIRAAMNSAQLSSLTLPLIELAHALALDEQPQRGLRALAAALSARVGYRLFTVLVLDRQAGLSRRYYSSQPDAYPTEDAKPIRADSEFYARVVAQGAPRICMDREACKAAFPDHERIFSLGCESAVNVPVRWDGQTIASLNLLHQARWYGEDMLPELACYSAFAIPVIQKIINTTR